MTQSIPRPEHPTPQFTRPEWLTLNGTWDFEIDNALSGRARGLVDAPSLNGSIVVPFCPESKLSGVGHTDFMNAVWYKRRVDIPSSWRGGRILLHFGAVDYAAEVWVGKQSLGTHYGGYVPFTYDITKYLNGSSFTLTVCATDDVRGGKQPCGKQSQQYDSFGCFYTRVTGIWQTVWLEHVPDVYLKRTAITPDFANGCAHIDARLSEWCTGTLTLAASLNGNAVGHATAHINGSSIKLTLPLDTIAPWTPETPILYDLQATLKTGDDNDTVTSYFGLRDVSMNGKCLTLNGKPIFQRLILDQGYYPDGIYTAPDDEALKNDILLSKAMGFNGARLHQKVFEPRTLYWADKLGYLLWDELPNWGLDITTPAASHAVLTEWLTVLERDYSSPAIIGWCPLNETHTGQYNELLRLVYNATKALDGTRPVIDTSGYVHVVTDIFDVHDYEQDPSIFAARHQHRTDGTVFVHHPNHEQYEGQPYFMSEYGGTWWSADAQDGWGYGAQVRDVEEFYNRFEGLTAALLQSPYVCGFCYTQLTDVEQEQNGLYTYDRRAKFDPIRIAAIVAAPAALETTNN